MTDIDPSAPGAMSVTFKHNGKYEDPWLVFHGSPGRIRDQIIEAFGFDPANAPDDLIDLVHEADSQAKAQYNAAKGLGAKALPKSEQATPASTGASTGFGAMGGQQAEPAKEVSPEERVAEQIANATSVRELQVDIWGPNQALLNSNDELMAAWKAKGKELSA